MEYVSQIEKFNFSKILILSMPSLIIAVEHISELSIFLIACIGVYNFIKDKNIFQSLDLKIYAAILIFFFLSVVLSVIGNNHLDYGLHKIGSYIHFLLAPFVAFAIYKEKVYFSDIIIAIKIAILIGFLLAIYQYFILGIRPEGGASSTPNFGHIMTLFAFIVIIDVFQNQTKKQKFFAFVLFILALYAGALSGARIAVIETFILFFIVFLLLHYNDKITKKHYLILLMLFLYAVVLTMSVSPLKERINIAFTEVNSFSISKDNLDSVGIRLKMWHAGWQAFKDKPFLGYGYHNAPIVASQYVRGTLDKKFIAGQKILHNDYIHALVGFGVIGLFIFLLLLFVPLRIFIRRMKDNFYQNAAGILFITASIVFAITDSIHSHATLRTFYIFILAVTLLRIKKAID